VNSSTPPSANDSEAPEELAEALPRLAEARRFLAARVSDTYQKGWKNHQTWARPLLDDRGPATDNLCRSLARQAVASAALRPGPRRKFGPLDQARRYLLADQFRELLDSRSPLIDSARSMRIVGTALYAVIGTRSPSTSRRLGAMTRDLFSNSETMPESRENYATPKKIRQWLLADPMLRDGCCDIAAPGAGSKDQTSSSRTTCVQICRHRSAGGISLRDSFATCSTMGSRG